MKEPGFSGAEWRVMNALWAGGPASAREVMARLGPGPRWAYNTVRTFLDRLVAKGLVKARRVGLAKRYAATVARDAAQRRAAGLLARQAFEGNVAGLVHFLLERERLSEAERKELLKLLQAKETRG